MLCDLMRPILVRSPRSSMKLLGWLGAGFGADNKFRKANPRYRAYWDRRLDAIVTTDLVSYSGRYSYYWGRFYDATHQAVLRHFLKNGDTYIDIGANFGYHSLLASRLVGEKGLVLSFEPHPETFKVMTAHMAMNRLFRCEALNLALGDKPGKAELTQTDDTHTGTSTLRGVARPARTFTVEIVRGDEVLAGRDFPGDVFVKIDVEGFEFRVLGGLRRTLSRVSAVSVEVTPEWLASQGASADQLYRGMIDLGFVPYIARLQWKLKLFAPSLYLVRAGNPLAGQHDVLFIRARSRLQDAAEALLRAQ
ncbi:MAG TPA: FkbM family methyltransferase [Bryobacteraceae bacterium]|nr:FkbM family methyltransferase [Bryobacteraceae bacterium]